MTAFSDWRTLAPFGVELTAVHSKVFDADAKIELRKLLERDGLLVIRGLELDMTEQRELCQAFGKVPDSPYENFYVSNQRADGFLGNRELQWHNDVPYLPSPYRVAVLHAVDVEPDATSTKFVSAMRAYERLPQPLRERVASLSALQVKQRVHDRTNRLEDLHPGDICTVHSVVGVQDRTRRPYLFVNENMTAGIIGLSAEDGDALLAELYGYLYAKSEVYEHRWMPGDLVVWDNLALQHARGAVGEGTRTLQRVTATEFTYLEQYPADMIIRTELNNVALLAEPAEVA